MDSYRTEEEQVEAIKTWWRENGQSTVLAIAIAVAGVFGWKWWQQDQQASVGAASAIYQELLSAISSPGFAQDDTKVATANHLAEQLKTDYARTTYSHFAALYKAKVAVEGNQLDAAEQELRWVLDNKPEDNIRRVTNLRLARVLMAKGEADQALSIADSADTGAYSAAYLEVKGDILRSLDRIDEAATAYRQAKDVSTADNTSASPLLDIKLQQLGVSDEQISEANQKAIQATLRESEEQTAGGQAAPAEDTGDPSAEVDAG